MHFCIVYLLLHVHVVIIEHIPLLVYSLIPEAIVLLAYRMSSGHIQEKHGGTRGVTRRSLIYTYMSKRGRDETRGGAGGGDGGQSGLPARGSLTAAELLSLAAGTLERSGHGPFSLEQSASYEAQAAVETGRGGSSSRAAAPPRSPIPFRGANGEGADGDGVGGEGADGEGADVEGGLLDSLVVDHAGAQPPAPGFDALGGGAIGVVALGAGGAMVEVAPAAAADVGLPVGLTAVQQARIDACWQIEFTSVGGLWVDGTWGWLWARNPVSHRPARTNVQRGLPIWHVLWSEDPYDPNRRPRQQYTRIAAKAAATRTPAEAAYMELYDIADGAQCPSTLPLCITWLLTDWCFACLCRTRLRTAALRGGRGTCARRLLEQRVPRLPGSWPGPAVPVSMRCCAAWGTALHGVLQRHGVLRCMGYSD